MGQVATNDIVASRDLTLFLRENGMSHNEEESWIKVPEVTLIFWIIKIAATTLGETGGDTVSMTLNWGYAVGTAIFLSLLVLLVAAQIAARKFQPFLYWATIEIGRAHV